MPATEVQETIGEYVVEAELGRGAHGVVYRAHHKERPAVPVALKVIENRGDMDRLLLEPTVLSQLRHPGIVGIEDYFLVDSDLVLALEFIPGQDLKTLLDEGQTFSPEEVRALLIQMGSALAEAHGKNIMHRDIKPANILVTRAEDGSRRYVLTDFGIGQVAEGIQNKKHAGGTYLFMAPEQLRGRPVPQSDLWALGVVAYRLLTGRFPFPGPSLNELAQQILYQTPMSPSQLCPQPIDPRLERTVGRLLDKSLQERVASAEEMLDLLGHKYKTSFTARLPEPERAKPHAQESLDQQIQRGLTRRWAILIPCVLLYLPKVVVKTLVSYFLMGGYVYFRYFQSALDYSPLQLVLVLATMTTASQWGSVVFLVVTAGFHVLVSYGLPLFACSLYVGVRRLHREKLLRDSALREGVGADAVLESLRRSLDTRFEDVGFHLKYAEALYASGRVKQAAVEGRLLLRQDPYNFNGNLLLANAYFQLELLDDCVTVCDNYLQVSGYCFEFSELREQCQRRLQQ
jgi:tRNA A-37 threonylcarbamoyl transferase component Bud32